MKNIILIITIILTFTACNKEVILDTNIYNCELSFADESSMHPMHSEFQKILDEVALVTPGAQAAITTSDGETWTGAVGYADIPNNIPFKKCTKTMIGSISKVATSVLIFQLHDEGILSIDDPLNKWLDESLIGQIENATQVSIKQLLDHTSGIKDYLAAKEHIYAVNIPNFLETQEEKLRYVYGKPAIFKPGASFEYSNTNFVLLGLVIEKARSMPLWDAVEKHIAQPLALKNLTMGTHNNPIPEGTARPYLATRSDKYIDIIQNSVADAATGDGGIATNMQDLNRFIEAVFSGELISSESLFLMTEATVHPDPTYGFENEGYALGIERYDSQHGRAFGHTGSTSSYEAYLLHFPKHGVTISLAYNGLSNLDESKKGELIWELAKVVFK